MPAIEVRGLTKRFAETTAVAGISFSVPEGSFTTLLGPSGCGKTTTLRLLAGLERPDAGEISLAGRVVAAPARGVFVPVEQRKVGVVFQSYALWPHMNVFDHVAYPLRVRRVPAAEIAQRVRTALEMVQLAGHTKRYPSELSGGQQQRVALARALVFDPSVLLLDEPLSNLDAALRNEMRAELARLHRETQVTSVYVTHDQSEALALSDRILLMRAGTIVEDGVPTDVYERPTTIYGARFVGAANCLTASVVEIGAAGATVRLGTGDVLHAHADALAAADVGSTVSVVIRPEDVAIAQAGDGLTNLAAGVLRQSTYLGSHKELLVVIGDQLVRVRAPKNVPIADGGPVTLHLPADALRLLVEK